MGVLEQSDVETLLATLDAITASGDPQDDRAFMVGWREGTRKVQAAIPYLGTRRSIVRAYARETWFFAAKVNRPSYVAGLLAAYQAALGT